MDVAVCMVDTLLEIQFVVPVIVAMAASVLHDGWVACGAAPSELDLATDSCATE